MSDDLLRFCRFYFCTFAPRHFLSSVLLRNIGFRHGPHELRTIAPAQENHPCFRYQPRRLLRRFASLEMRAAPFRYKFVVSLPRSDKASLLRLREQWEQAVSLLQQRAAES